MQTDSKMRRASMKIHSLFAFILIFSQPLVAPTVPVSATQVTADQIPALLLQLPENRDVKYVRKKFEHWTDTDRDGCNTRYEVLKRDSLDEYTIYDRCKLSGGSWLSKYDGFIAYSTQDIEIDHVVALAEAWRSGAWQWNDETRKEFANDLSVDYTLVPSSTKANQSKADKDPAKWLPQVASYQCEYVTNWALIKYRWSLTVDQAEQTAISDMLSGDCGAQVIDLPEQMPIALETHTPTDDGPAVQGPSATIASFGNGTTRLYGADRYMTAVEVSKRFAPKVDVAFVATGANFPDALAAAAAASKLGGPLLLTQPNTLPSVVSKELKRLKPTQIIVVGAEGAVNKKVFNELTKIAPSKRLGGKDRYATGHKVVEHAFPSAETVFIATGADFPDALAASGAAGLLEAPVMLVDGQKNTLSASVNNQLRSLKASKVVLIGGSGAVTSGIQNQLKDKGYSVSRLGGADRYATAAEINNKFFAADSTKTIFLATELNFPDALAGAALAGQVGAPLFVTSASCAPSSVQSSITSLTPTSTVVLGGTSVISNNAAKNMVCAQPAKKKPSKPTNFVANHVSPGAYCKKADAGKNGYTKTGVQMTCKKSATDSRLRWRQA